MSDIKFFTYDIEVLVNYFCCILKEYGTEELLVIELDDLDLLRQLMSNPDNKFIGYNNDGYDAQVLMHVFKLLVDNGSVSHYEIYEYSRRYFANELLDSETYYIPFGNQIDLLQIVPPHLKVGDGTNTGSLKKQGFRMREASLIAPPIDWNEPLPENRIPEIIKYCGNDVRTTERFFEEIQDCGGMEIRAALTQAYPFLKNNEAFVRTDSALATRIMKTLYQEATGDRLTNGMVSNGWVLHLNQIIFPNIRFRKEVNQTALNDLKAIPPVPLRRGTYVDPLSSEVKNKWHYGTKEFNEGYLLDIEFEFQGHYTDVAVGGAHFYPKQGHVKGNLVDIDVASYYPRIIINNNKSPSHCKEVWLSIFEGIVNKRLEYKAAGNKVGADALKIIINSLYGKLNAWGVFLDPILSMTVTMNGQLMLYELMEDLELANFHIVSANTDGVLVDAGEREDELVAIRDAWCKRHKLEAGFDKYTDAISTNINDYIWVDEAGTQKAKGLFAQNIKLPDICKKAVADYFIKGTRVEDSIRGGNDLFDYLYFGNAGQAVKDLKQGTEILNDAIRFYKTVDEVEPIMKHFHVGKIQKLPNGDNAVIVNLIEDSNLPTNIDYQHYIDKTLKLIAPIEAGAVGDTKGNPVRIAAMKLAGKTNLFVTPKGREDKAKANLYGKIPVTIEEYLNYIDVSWRDYNGYGCMTGQAFNTLAIDVDDIDIAVKSGLFDVITKSSAHFCAWHGLSQLGKQDEVRTGQKRGTLLFQYSGNEFETSGEVFAKANGFEILYGKKVVQLSGKHTNGDAYSHTGGLVKPLPDKLKKFLLGCIREESFFDKGKSHPKVQLKNAAKPIAAGHEYKGCNFTLEGHDTQKARMLKASGGGDEKLINLVKDLVDSDTVNTLHLSKPIDGSVGGYCPWHTDGEMKELSFRFKDHRLTSFCHGQHCTEAREKYIKDITNHMFNDMRKVEVLEAVVIEDEDIPDVRKPIIMDSIESVFDIKKKFKVCLAGTGAGKTYTSAKVVVDKIDWGLLEDKNNPTRYIIAVPSIDRIKGTLNEIYDRLDVDPEGEDFYKFGFNHGICAVMRSTADFDVPDDWKIIITHFTYLSRKGATDFHYSAMKYFSPDVHVIMDELDAYITALTIDIPFGARTYEKETGALTYQERCPMDAFNSMGELACKTCVYRQEAFNYRLDTSTRVYDLQRRTIEANVNYPIMQSVNLTDWYGNVVNDITLQDTTSVKFLEEYPIDEIEMKIDGADRNALVGDIDDYVNDVRNKAWHPCVHESFPVLNETGEFTDPDYIRDMEYDDMDDLRAKVTFPYYACKVPKFIGVDRVPMLHIAENCASFTGLTATLPTSHMDFMHDCGMDVNYYKVPVAEDRKIENCHLIFIRSNSSRNYMRKLIKEVDWREKRILAFYKSKNTVKSEWNLLKDEMGGKRLAYYNEADRMELNHNEYDCAPHVTMLYYRSPLSRGANLGQYKVSVLAGDPIPPYSFCAASTEEELMRNVLEDRIDTMQQAGGRNMRADQTAEDPVEDRKERFMIIDESKLYIKIDGELTDDARQLIERLFIDNLDDLCHNVITHDCREFKGEGLVAAINHIINGKTTTTLMQEVEKFIWDNRIDTMTRFRKEFDSAIAKQITSDLGMKEMVEGYCRDVKYNAKIMDIIEGLAAGDSEREMYKKHHVERWGTIYKDKLAELL